MPDSGSGQIEVCSQQMTRAASAIAERKTVGRLPYRVATRRQPLSQPKLPSIRLRRLYRRLSYQTLVMRCFRQGMQARMPLSFNVSLDKSASSPLSQKQPIDSRQAAQQRPRRCSHRPDLRSRTGSADALGCRRWRTACRRKSRAWHQSVSPPNAGSGPHAPDQRKSGKRKNKTTKKGRPDRAAPGTLLGSFCPGVTR